MSDPIPQEYWRDAAWAINALRRRGIAYRLARRYYRGDHRLSFASPRFRSAFGRLFREFSANLCEPVVDIVADRLHVIGFEDGDGDPAAGVSDQARALWDMAEMPLVADEVHHEALITGDAYVIVWPSDDGVGVDIVAQRAEECIVRYGPTGQPRYAAKWWWDEDSERGRLTMYYPDRLVRAATTGRVKEPAELPQSLDQYQLLAADDPDGPGIVPHAWGTVPVVHFGHKAGRGSLGVSCLQSVVPVQDALNKALLDALVGSEYVALPQRWATGVESDTEDDLVAGVDRLITSTSADSRMGQFPGADLPGLVTWIDSFREDICRITGTPRHLLLATAGQPPSGEALKVAEARLVARAEGCARRWGPRWAQVVSLGLRMIQEPPDRTLLTLWAPAASRSERELAETAEVKAAAGVPWRQRMRELGYSEADILQMEDDLEEERARAVDHGAVP